MRYLLAGICCVLGALQALAALPPDTPRPDMWIPNGTQNGWVKYKDKLFVGGDFTMWGQHSGGLVRTNAQTGEILSTWPNLTGEIRDFRPDGDGGLFVAGEFHDTNTGTLYNLARITPDGHIDNSFNPSFNGHVKKIIIEGSTLYAIGAFTVVNGQTRNYICALNIPSGTNTAWDPNANNTIRRMHLLGSTLYVVGDFTTIGGQTRTRMAALDINTNTNNALAWAPDPDGNVSDIAIDGTTMYVVGAFANIGGQNVPSIARISTTGAGAADASWNPAVTGTVSAIALHSGVLYCGGSFSNLGGAARMYMGAINIASQAATDFNPVSNNAVSRVQIRGNKLFVAGDFTKINNVRTPFNVCFDLDAGTIAPWQPMLGLQAQRFRAQGDNVIVSGGFDLTGGKWARGIACIDLPSGKLSNDFNYELNNGGHIRDFVIRNDILYFGGAFSAVNGTSRNNAAAINLANGSVTPWSPNFNGEIRRMLNDGDTLYAAGNFTAVNGQTRNYLAAVSLTNNSLFAWNPNANGVSRELNLVDGRLLIGGDFTMIAGVNSAYLSAIDPDPTSGGNHINWAPTIDARVRTIHATENHVLIGGDFTTVSGQGRAHVAMLNRTDGNLNNFTLNADASVRSITSIPGYLLVAGHFGTIDGHNIKGLAAYDLATGNINTSWITRPSFIQGGVRRLLSVGRTLYVSSEFSDTPYMGNFRAFQSGVMEPTNVAEIPGSELATDYKMICLSHRVDANKSVMQSLIQRFGPYDITRWRLYRWAGQSQQYFEGPDIPGITSSSPVLHPAFGYWILARNSIFVNFDAGVSPYEDIVVPIYPGWNMIGNPFPETLEAIDDAQQRFLQVRSATSRWRSLTGNQPWINKNVLRWRNNTYEPITNWKAFHGAWINNTSNETVYLRMRGPAG